MGYYKYFSPMKNLISLFRARLNTAKNPYEKLEKACGELFYIASKKAGSS